MSEMFMDNCFSSIGRTTHQHLNNLRRQLGTGVDPAFDYSAMLQHQKELASAGKKGIKERAAAHADGGSAPTSGLDLLKRTLKEVVGVGAGLEDADSDRGNQDAGHRRARSSPADVREQREANRNTSAFMASTRESLKKLDIENRFRAPPMGTYRPKDDMMRPRMKGDVTIQKLERTKSLKTIAIENEIERLQEEGEPVEHLTKPAVSIELKEGIPDHPPQKQRMFTDMSKQIPRPDMTKVAKIKYHDNSFTAGVLDAHNGLSHFERQDIGTMDFAKTSTAPDKPREYYFQPGQYAVKWDVAKPKLELKNVPFHKQTVRPQLMSSKSDTIHLPDRSNARPTWLGQAHPNQSERKIPHIQIGKCTDRKPIYDYVPPMYDASDPKVQEAVLHNYNSYDAFDAIKSTQPRMRSAMEFKKDLTRHQHQKCSRSYGNDINLTLARTNLTQGPVSIELLPRDAMYEKPSLQPKIVTTDLKTMAGREQSRLCIELPPRGKVDDLSKVMSFERGTRPGDSRADAQNLSRLAGAITELRGSRSYDALPKEEHPRPSVELE